MSSFNGTLRRLARSRRAYWQRAIGVAVAGCFRRREWGQPNIVRYWLRVEVSGQELMKRGPRVHCVTVRVGLPARHLSLMFTGTRGDRYPATRDRIAIVARAAAVHEAWLVLHGKDTA